MQHIRDGIMVVNTETIAGKVITQNLGVVGGSTVRAKHIGKDIGALFKNIGGGELRAYTELLEESRNEAIARMVADCLLYTSPSPRDRQKSRMPSSA